MRVLILGGAGFLGSHVVDVLILRGRDVLVVDNLTTAELDEETQGPRWRNPSARYSTVMFPDADLREVSAVVHLALRHPLERERAVWAVACEGYVTFGVRLLMELLDLRGPLQRFVLCGPGRVDRCNSGEGRMVDALRTLLGYWHRPPNLGVYCLWAPELTGRRRAVPISEGELTASVYTAAERLADLADGTAKHRREPDVNLEVGE